MYAEQSYVALTALSLSNSSVVNGVILLIISKVIGIRWGW